MPKAQRKPCAVDNFDLVTAQGQNKAQEMSQSNFNAKAVPITGNTAPFKALEWKRDHLDAYELMARIAIDMRNRGLRPSMDYIMAKMRMMDYPSSWKKLEDGYKLNNTLGPSLARMLMRDYPKLEGLFELRKSRADKVFDNE